MPKGSKATRAGIWCALIGALAACGPAAPSPIASPSPAAVTIDGATCARVEEDVCGEVLVAAVNNLARNHWAFRPPATVIQDTCPEEMPDYADGPACWYVTLPLAGREAAQVIMARRQDGVVAQVGGDNISGQVIPND
jgi:hypothetical protein